MGEEGLGERGEIATTSLGFGTGSRTEFAIGVEMGGIRARSR